MPLEFEKTLPLVRVYFNRRDESPLIWSVDDGDQANEVNVAQVVFEGTSSLKYIGGGKSKDTPVAWIKMYQARIHKTISSSTLFIENTEE
jgi:hypothetical protein